MEVSCRTCCWLRDGLCVIPIKGDGGPANAPVEDDKKNCDAVLFPNARGSWRGLWNSEPKTPLNCESGETE